MAQRIDFTRTTLMIPEVAAAIDDAFASHGWDAQQQANSQRVRDALAFATRTIVENVPICADRTVAIRKLIEASMDCNRAITFGGG